MSPARLDRIRPIAARPWVYALAFMLMCTAAQSQPGNATDKFLPLEVIVNGAKSGTWVLIEREGILYAPQDAFNEWRVNTRPSTPPLNHQGILHFPLSAVPGFNSRLDLSTQTLDLIFSPQAFSATRLAKDAPPKPVPGKVLPSLFFNYDLNYNASDLRDAPSVQTLGALTELGISTPFGVLTQSHVGRNLISSGFGASPSSWRRLETTFTTDFPASNLTLRLGDANTRTGLLGRNVYFGGLQLGTNYALTPGFVGQPIPSVSGLSAAPSTVELYINDVLRQTSNVPTGPFTLDNLPSLSGSGEARVVVRDLLGRETVIVQPFFSSPQLLGPGLNEWSLELGSVRRDLGVSNSRYGSGFSSGLWRRGLTPGLTFETRGEISSNIQTLELGAIAALPGAILGRTAVMGSRAKESTAIGAYRSGVQWLLGADYTGLRTNSSLQIQGASKNFRQLGQDLNALPTELQIAGNTSYTQNSLGTLGAGFAVLERHDSPRISTFTASYSRRIAGKAYLSLIASRAIAGGNGTNIGITLVMPLDANIVAVTSVNHQNKQTDFYASATKNPEQDGDLGWRLLAGEQQKSARAEAGLFYAGRYGRLTGDLSASRDQTALRFGASGGIVFTDGQLFASQRINDSFALVQVEGYPGINITLGGQPQGRTDASGTAFLPRLAAYQSNSVRLDASGLPINAELDTIELAAVPAWRSGVKVIFPVRVGRGALLSIVLDDGEAAPAGAVIKIEGDAQEFYLARRGQAFVTGLLNTINRLQLTWKGQQCSLDAALTAAISDEIPRLGPIVCKGVKR